MATQLFLWSRTAPNIAHRFGNGESYTTLAGATRNRNMSERLLATTRDAGTINVVGATVAGPTAGVEIELASFAPSFWVSKPLAAAATISGSITFNLWASESNMSANVAINARLFKVAALDGAITEIIKTARTTEVALTTNAVNNFAATPPSGVALDRGDRLALVVFGDDAGTMASGFTFQIGDSGTTGGADGDSYITLTETLSFESDPAGTVVYLTDTSAGINPGSATELQAWSSRGAGVTTSVTNTVNGPTAKIQLTATAGGTAVEWYTKQLTATTLNGPIAIHLRGKVSNGSAAYLIEVAKTDSDGTNATIWGINTSGQAGAIEENAGTVEGTLESWVSGPSMSITDGQRIRIRVYIDDAYSLYTFALGTMVSGGTATMYYAGTSGGASGDTFVTFTQTLTEFVAQDRIPVSRQYPQLLAQ